MDKSLKEQAVELLNQAVTLLGEHEKQTGDSTVSFESKILVSSAGRLSGNKNPQSTTQKTTGMQVKFMPKRDRGAAKKILGDAAETTNKTEKPAASQPFAKEESEKQAFDLIAIKAIGSNKGIGDKFDETQLSALAQWLGFGGSLEGKSKTQLGAIILQKLNSKSDAELKELTETFNRQLQKTATHINAAFISAAAGSIADLKNIMQAASEEEKKSEFYAQLEQYVQKAEAIVAKGGDVTEQEYNELEQLMKSIEEINQ